ncbi:MAG: ABC transporter ATP-binding protein/permease [Actinobacteria bacterium]|nr:ABC transporter ATP-binding protein/permease [Actinomycetota bacterium]
MTTTQAKASAYTSIRRAVAEAPIIARRLWVVLLLNLGGTVVQVLIPVIVQQTLDRYVGGAGVVDVGGVATAVAVGMVIVVVGGVMTRFGLVRLVTQASMGMSDLRVLTFRHLFRRSVLHVQSERRGSLVSRVTSDVQTVQEFMEWGGVMFLVNGTQVVVALGVMAAYEWRLALIVTVGVVVYVANMLWSQRLLRRRYDAVRENVADSLAVMGEAINALPAIRAHGAETITMGRVEESLENRFWAQFKAAHLGNVLFATSELFAAAVTTAVIVVGLLMGPEQGITAGVLLAFLFLVNLLIAPIQTLVEILDFAQSAASGLRRIIATLDAPIEIPEAADPLDLPPGPLEVAFEAVGFRYIDGPEVLADVTLSVGAGSRVAVVGATGSGKTTFAKLLVRLLDPDRGVVRVGGIDVRDVSWKSLRSRVAFVPQEGFLFTGTIADNIRYGKPSATDEQVRFACEELGLDRWLRTTPEGIATPVGERGSSLSAGERQLVALARAWISDPDLLLLDEATSAVDPALDVALRAAMDRLIAGRTSVTVAHRLATAEAADTVLVFDAGRLVESGPHRDLVRAGGVYAALYADWETGTAVM